MKDRSAHRIRTSCPLAYVGVTHDLEGVANTIELSFKGCRAFSPSPPSVGTKLHVSISPGHNAAGLRGIGHRSMGQTSDVQS